MQTPLLPFPLNDAQLVPVGSGVGAGVGSGVGAGVGSGVGAGVGSGAGVVTQSVHTVSVQPVSSVSSTFSKPHLHSAGSPWKPFGQGSLPPFFVLQQSTFIPPHWSAVRASQLPR